MTEWEPQAHGSQPWVEATPRRSRGGRCVRYARHSRWVRYRSANKTVLSAKYHLVCVLDLRTLRWPSVEALRALTGSSRGRVRELGAPPTYTEEQCRRVERQERRPATSAQLAELAARYCSGDGH